MIFAIRARSIYRKSRADEGRLGIWLVQAMDADDAQARWEQHNATSGGEWVFESAAPDPRPVIRML